MWVRLQCQSARGDRVRLYVRRVRRRLKGEVRSHGLPMQSQGVNKMFYVRWEGEVVQSVGGVCVRG